MFEVTGEMTNDICFLIYALKTVSPTSIESERTFSATGHVIKKLRTSLSYLLNPKSNCTIGTWNVQTMYSTSKTAQIVQEMGNYQLDILGISECRWTGSGKVNTKNDK